MALAAVSAGGYLWLQLVLYTDVAPTWLTTHRRAIARSRSGADTRQSDFGSRLIQTEQCGRCFTKLLSSSLCSAQLWAFLINKLNLRDHHR